ncbi:2-dehydro-3-deoxygalactonokinase [Verminephrobacter aporrectodeae]|uniref:2-dehydro-3-deoxygalactonokinase n=1 Tax=Verminephrobacter aporrectodeae subsp. tuberculatae TaxID=1110392 RepID=A0ABT3KP05_9BURK|nr:2-dehydro-3-deoxygalactonokinase [Verminephrobacter aporrectodeae]MCW5320039.1 2-dehydro-3-deoxygalactonokinase [Verminephrobacter aporrectodeae subsp. tuberculatae]MCW8164673.1 2-dehydro-3-deoxygalactonokinase [Verminephrobacter aporrectodeae subsp. tuberculatae]MCW8169341.1 2-dehydro-3-deoxygalactonokinase [Verminephrobacter aporrectodeae subsp. tuberculatae]MCW8175419.1 2-dehydro-3-deoxygalactonokinase [Verminephrobacter aporrectodeae subsp. tuberculatae]MCW8203364.1 2-dehydro-3-deoxygal
MSILTIDSGTTNTRSSIWKNGVPWCQATRQVGVRDTAVTGNKTVLQNGVRDTIAAVLHRAGLGISDVSLVLASGMITSNVGLFELAHLPAPAGVNELAAGMQQALLPQVCEKPIWFVPGVRNQVENIGLHNCEAMDMMRGEEAETMGLVERMQIAEPTVIALPGSHSKFVHLDAQQRIVSCVTTLSGELLHVITHNTILADSLRSDFADRIDAEMLLAGARSASSIGLGRACFTVRTLGQFTIYDRNARANFLLGAVLGADLLTLKNSSALRMSPETRFIVTGKPTLRHALSLLVSNDDFFSGTVSTVSDDEQDNLAGYGAIRLARARGLLDAA